LNDGQDFDFADQGIIWSVSNVPPTPAMEEAIAITTKGKAARIFERNKH